MTNPLEMSKVSGLTMTDLETASRAIARVAASYGIAAGAAARMIQSAIGGGDLRAASWSARLLLFDSSDTLTADSDDGAPYDQPGATILRGLGAVFDWACDLVAAFQPEVDRAALLSAMVSREGSLRVTVSRAGNGCGGLRVPYQTEWGVHHARLEVARRGGAA